MSGVGNVVVETAVRRGRAEKNERFAQLIVMGEPPESAWFLAGFTSRTGLAERVAARLQSMTDRIDALRRALRDPMAVLAGLKEVASLACASPLSAASLNVARACYVDMERIQARLAVTQPAAPNLETATGYDIVLSDEAWEAKYGYLSEGR